MPQHSAPGQMGLQLGEPRVRFRPSHRQGREGDGEVEVVRDRRGVVRRVLAVRSAVHAVQHVVRRLAHGHDPLADDADVIAVRVEPPAEGLAGGEGVIEDELRTGRPQRHPPTLRRCVIHGPGGTHARLMDCRRPDRTRGADTSRAPSSCRGAPRREPGRDSERVHRVCDRVLRDPRRSKHAPPEVDAVCA